MDKKCEFCGEQGQYIIQVEDLGYFCREKCKNDLLDDLDCDYEDRRKQNAYVFGSDNI